ncbi:lipoyl(octanoyl) transferase LipB [Achromobacter denitrificans]|uniref:lipoyl(octanoyl) transferase LipB n=1 Tax=Achromobacter denitrificans TaxID=32002 RepID=UPI00166320CF|nr:lipoyl(octanoyl) transferase LipB [Achromobacter denitrificans]MDF3940342.1 lipoyl(octanoyl) transferase LipB [Achromobacter denitrificans]GFN27051.1 octanoyltransferase [Achromobacter denitrificans]
MIKWLARPADYLSVWQDMQAYTNLRGADTPDEIWLCEHAPVYTLGQAGLPQHILNPGDIPIVRCDRGGQVTYHGPGQVMAYALFDLRRADMYVKEYVTLLEGAVIDTLAQLGVQHACRKPGAPGVYVPDPQGGDLAKIAALGIKIRNGRAYHGVSLNVSMDLAPFLGINPCGYQGLRTVDMASCGARREPIEAGDALGRNLQLAWARARNKT